MRNGQAYQRKKEKFSVSEEKKFGKINSSWFLWSTIRKSYGNTALKTLLFSSIFCVGCKLSRWRRGSLGQTTSRKGQDEQEHVLHFRTVV